VVGVTRPIVEDIRTRLGVEALLITNGFDPDEMQKTTEKDGVLDPRRHSLVHTGRLSLAQTSVQPLLDAVRIVSETEPVAGKLELVFAGSVTDEERRALSAPELAGTVRFVGWLDRSRALALQRAADTLLVVTEGASRRSVATGKLFEYLGSGRPILVLGDETEAARIVEETGSGSSAPASDTHAIAAALRRLVEAPPTTPAQGAAAEYAYPVLVERLAESIEDVVSRRTS
jgi:glycosyltransferase involved in cell wall biosynthesis